MSLWKIYDQFKELCSQGSNMANESYKNVLPSSGVIQCITIRFFTFAWKCFYKSALQGWYLCEFVSISDDPFPGPGIQRENTVTLTFDNFVTFCNFFFWNQCSVYSGVFVYLETKRPFNSRDRKITYMNKFKAHTKDKVLGEKSSRISDKNIRILVIRLSVTFGSNSEQNEVIDSDIVVRREIEWSPLQSIILET